MSDWSDDIFGESEYIVVLHHPDELETYYTVSDPPLDHPVKASHLWRDRGEEWVTSFSNVTARLSRGWDIEVRQTDTQEGHELFDLVENYEEMEYSIFVEKLEEMI